MVDPLSGQKQFSEENVRKVVRYLSENIGYRIVGTEQDQQTQVYLLHEINTLKELAEKEAIRRSNVSPVGQGITAAAAFPKFEVWTQKDDGAHQFDFMSKGMHKKGGAFFSFPWLSQIRPPFCPSSPGEEYCLA